MIFVPTIFSLFCFSLAITVGMDQVRVVVNEDIGTVQPCASVMRETLERQAVVTVIYENRGAMGKFI